MDWLTQSPWLAWLGIALILAAIEAATVDFVFVMLAGGALAGALTAALGGGLVAQAVVAAAVATLLLLVVRPIVRRHFVEGQIDHGIGAAVKLNAPAEVHLLQLRRPDHGRFAAAQHVDGAGNGVPDRFNDFGLAHIKAERPCGHA